MPNNVSPQTFRAYLKAWRKAVLAGVLDVVGTASLIVGGALWCWHKYRQANFEWAVGQIGITPEDAMSDLVWQGPLFAGGALLVYRFFRAPYEMHLASETANSDRMAQLEGQLSEARRQAESALTAEGPQLRGYVDYFFQIPYKRGSIIGLLLNITNKGTPSLAHQWRIYVAIDGQLERQIDQEVIARQLTLRFPNGKVRTIDGKESIVHRVAHAPITSGAGQRGWIFASPRADLPIGTKVTVRFRDVNDRESSAEHVVQAYKQHLGDYAGITATTNKHATEFFDVTPPAEPSAE